LTISLILRKPEPKTTALGGVATGNINAQEAAIVAPTIIIRGWISIEILTEAKIGKIIDTVAKFDVISVKKLTINTTEIRISIIFKLFNTVIFSPIQRASPLPIIAAANDNPPPNNNIIPHGIFELSSHEIIFSFFFFELKINKSTAKKIAIIVSSIKGIKRLILLFKRREKTKEIKIIIL